MRHLFKITIALFICQYSAAQEPNGNHLEVEADPIAFIFNGYSFHAGYQVGHIRYDAGVFGIRQPEFALENKNFSVFSSGVGIKADYIFRKNRGVFLGLQSDYATDKIRLISSENEHVSAGITLGVRTGYRFVFGKREKDFKGLYLVPWMALIHSFNPANVNESGQRYTPSKWSVFPTIHLGYRF